MIFAVIHFGAMLLDLALIVLIYLRDGEKARQTAQYKREQRELIFFSTIPAFNVLVLILMVYSICTHPPHRDD
jgi:hypothetical protein